MNDLLADQLKISWGLGQYYLPTLTDEIALWKPSSRAVTVRQTDSGRWLAEMPDEQADPVPDTTVGWLLWHIEWWWTNALLGVEGAPAVEFQRFPWSGSVAASTKLITDLHDQWEELLSSTAPDQLCTAPFPQPQPFEQVAAWLNVELMKNVAEIGQTTRLFQNRDGGFERAATQEPAP